MLDRTPEGLETPKYEVLAEKGAWEVREYQEFSVCSTEMQNGPGAFNTLAGYIFGKNKVALKNSSLPFCRTAWPFLDANCD